MPLTEQLIVRASGPVTRDVLDRLRALLRLQRTGRLTDAEDVHFGLRYLRTDGDLTNIALLRDDDTHWRVKLNYLDEPLPAETVARVRADVLAAFAEVGLAVDGVWQREESSRPGDG